jgi:predicted RNase H-like HicB family nuclease
MLKDGWIVSTRCTDGQGANIVHDNFTAVIEREGDGYVALCPELDIASQGDSIEDAARNLREAIELFLACASPEEISTRRKSEIYITRLDVKVA